MRWGVRLVLGASALVSTATFAPLAIATPSSPPPSSEVTSQRGQVSGQTSWGIPTDTPRDPDTGSRVSTGPASELSVEVVIPAGSAGDCNNTDPVTKYAECGQMPLPPESPAPAPSGSAAAGPSVAEVARLVVVRLRLPDPTPQFGPDPSVNEWQMIPVGYPVWLWTEGPDDLSATTQAYGYTFTLRAERTSTVFVLGDGHSVTCTGVTPYTAAVTPGSASPTCGYTYAEPSRPGPDYAVSATTRWRVTWTAAGETGVITATHTGNSTLAVGELFALVTK